jgi:hypothetical protein
MIATPDKQLNDSQIRDAFYGPSAESTDHSPRAQRQRRVQRARELLVRKGHTADSAVFVTSAEIMDDSDLEETPARNKPLPMVCEVTGHYAAYLIADRTHRLATEEEIHRFRQEQIAREKTCAEIEAKNPNNRQLHQNITYMVNPEQVKQAVPATAEVPARFRRSAEAGEKELQK